MSPEEGAGAIGRVTARILASADVPEAVRDLIAGMADLGRGQGPEFVTRPGALLGLADRIDHKAMDEVREGETPGIAIRNAIGWFRTELTQRHGEGADTVLADARDILSAIWVLGRGAEGG